MKIAIPGQNVSIQSRDGQIDPIWYERLSQMAAFVSMFGEVSPATLTNGDVFIWNATTKRFEPGAN
jgi:hypothetical protein